MSKTRQKWTPKKEQFFLEQLRKGNTAALAASKVGVSRATVYAKKQKDSGFSERWGEAVDEGTEVLEQEAFRRAVHGTKKPIYQGGELVGVVQEYSDTLMIFLLKARRPEIYRERVEQHVMHSGRVQVEFVGDWRAS